MADGYLQLDLGSLSVTIDRFVGEKYPRVHIDTGSTEYSMYGNLIGYGRAVEEPHMWTVEALVTMEEAEILTAMYWEHSRLKRIKSVPDVTVTDTTFVFTERSPRTRAKAASPFDTETTFATSYVKYYAQYYAWFQARPEILYRGHRYANVSFTLYETENKVSPA